MNGIAGRMLEAAQQGYGLYHAESEGSAALLVEECINRGMQAYRIKNVVAYKGLESILRLILDTHSLF